MKKAGTLNNERGSVKSVLVLLILACMVYVGIKLGIPYYKYSAFKSEAKAIARISSASQHIRTLTQVYERAQEMNIPLEEEDINITTTSKGVRIETGWTETVDFFGIYQYTFDFTVDVEG